MTDLLSLSQNEICEYLKESGFPSFRGKQLFKWLYTPGISDFDEMVNLPKDLRSFLKDSCVITGTKQLLCRESSLDDSAKLLLDCSGEYIETVVMSYDEASVRRRNTICISTQAGCAMGCRFCGTGLSGFRRNLTPGEIMSQLYYGNAFLKRKGEPPLDNVVVMGMGEPLKNTANLLKALEIIHEGLNIGMRRITVSTCGIIPEIQRLTELKPGFRLAVSLHSPFDDVRSSLMPVNRKYPVGDLFPVLKRWSEVTGRRVSLEYVMLKGVNDRDEDAGELIRLTRGGLFHVNLIPGNEVEGSPYKPSSKQRIAAFAGILQEGGTDVTVRHSRGRDIEGACGQLRGKYLKNN